MIHGSRAPPSYRSGVGSGLVYAAVGLVWLWYIGTRVQHAREDRRTGPNASSAPGRIVRRAAAEAQDAALVDGSAGGPGPDVVGAPVVDPAVAQTRALDPAAAAARRAARRATVRRRRAVLAVLVSVSIVLGVIAALGLVPAAAAAPAPLLAVAYVAAVSRQRSRSVSATGQGAPVSGAGSTADDPSWAGVPYVEVVADWCRTGERSASDASAAAPAVEDAPPALDADDVPRIVAPAPGSWRAVPVPLPTYVTAPRVARTVSTIDLGSTGAWTSGRMAPPPLALPTGAAPASEPGTAAADAGPAAQAEAVPAVADDEATEALELPRAAAG